MSNYYSKRKRTIVTVVLLVVTVLVLGKFTISKHSAKNLQEAFQNDNVLGLSRLISFENEKKQDEFMAKFDQVTSKMMLEQRQRLDRLEKQQQVLLDEIRTLKTPPPHASLRDKLVYMYRYDPSVKFPAYIWQSWKYGLIDERFEQKFRDGESQWAWKNPGFVHELFNDDTAHTIIKYLYRQVPEVIETYEKLPEIILKMDFFRYLILFAKGGVYADVDTYPLQPIPNWIPENVSPDELGMIFSIETDSNSPDWKKEVVHRLQFGQFVVQAKPGHPVLREAIARIVEETANRVRKLEPEESLRLKGSPHEKVLDISRWTGAGLWTDVVFHYFNDYIQSSVFQKITWKEFHGLEVPKLVSDVLVLPVHSFASEIEIPKDGKISDPLAFVKHYAASIWKST